MTVHVCSVFAPRDPIAETHPPWAEYIPMLRLQRDSARWFGHRHTVITDANLDSEFDTLRTPLDADLMPAMISGVLARLQSGGPASHIVFLDCDCLVLKNLDEAFEGELFDVGLTHRANDVAPINNGAMYVNASGIPAASGFFRHAWALCGTHWGADQEAISKAAEPVPHKDCVAVRRGCRIGFLDMKRYAAVPKRHLSQHGGESFVAHFKGQTKRWMEDYANAFIFQGEARGARG